MDNESDIRPRPKQPSGHGPQTVARIHPMVPEVSVFYPSCESVSFNDGLKEPFDRVPTDSKENFTQFTQQHIVPSIDSDVGSIPEAVLPQRYPLVNASKLPASNPGVDHGIYKALELQNEQLERLTQQIERLLTMSNKEHLNDAIVTPIKSRSLANVTDISTQTSAPCSPRKTLPKFFDPLQFPELNKENIVMSSHRSVSSTLLPSPDRAGVHRSASSSIEDQVESENMAHRLDMMLNVSSPVIIAETSGEEIFKSPSVSSDGPKEKCPPFSPEEHYINRLRQLGISFVSPEDLKTDDQHNAVREERRLNVPFDSIITPRLHQMSTPLNVTTGKTTPASSDSSLLINSTALRYLDDIQLTSLAKAGCRHPRTDGNQGGQDGPDHSLTRYGLGADCLSMSTKQYLKQNIPHFLPPHESIYSQEVRNGRKMEEPNKPSNLRKQLIPDSRQITQAKHKEPAPKNILDSVLMNLPKFQ